MVNLDILKGLQFKEEDDNAPDTEQSIKEIILRQIKKIGDISAQEFTGGYWQKKPFKTGGGVIFSEEYHEDTREAYCNAVEFIIDLSLPYALIEKDEKLLTIVKEEEGKNIDDIKLKLKSRRLLFRELNYFYQRVAFFESTDGSDE